MSIQNALNRTLEHVKSCNQYLEQQKLQYEEKLKSITEEIFEAKEYSMVDSLVREQMEDLIRKQKKLTREQELLTKMLKIVNETFNHLDPFRITNPEQEKTLKSFQQFKQRGLFTYAHIF